jgi:phosphoglucosamine mutase
MPRFPQVKENVPTDGGPLPEAVSVEADRLNAELAGTARVLVRSSGTEPLVRVLAEAKELAKAQELCASMRSLVLRELG